MYVERRGKEKQGGGGEGGKKVGRRTASEMKRGHREGEGKAEGYMILYTTEPHPVKIMDS